MFFEKASKLRWWILTETKLGIFEHVSGGASSYLHFKCQDDESLLHCGIGSGLSGMIHLSPWWRCMYPVQTKESFLVLEIKKKMLACAFWTAWVNCTRVKEYRLQRHRVWWSCTRLRLQQGNTTGVVPPTLAPGYEKRKQIYDPICSICVHSKHE